MCKASNVDLWAPYLEEDQQGIYKTPYRATFLTFLLSTSTKAPLNFKTFPLLTIPVLAAKKRKEHKEIPFCVLCALFRQN